MSKVGKPAMESDKQVPKETMGETKMKKYNVVFATSYVVEAEDDNGALDKAETEFAKDLEEPSTEWFGSSVEEV